MAEHGTLEYVRDRAQGREAAAYKMRLEGMTFKKIAERITHIKDNKPITTERARQLAFRGERNVKGWT